MGLEEMSGYGLASYVLKFDTLPLSLSLPRRQNDRRAANPGRTESADRTPKPDIKSTCGSCGPFSNEGRPTARSFTTLE